MTTTIKTITPVQPAGRATVTRLATAAVLAAMALSVAGGTAAAAPAAPLPTFTGYGNSSSDTPGNDDGGNGGGAGLAGALLSAAQASSAAGLSGLRQVATSDHLMDNSDDVSPVSCISSYAPAQAAAYSSVTPQAVAQRLLRDAGKNHVITEAVVTMAGKQDALAQMKASVASWKRCAGQTITQTPADGSGQTRQWTNDKPRINDDRTVVSMSQTAGDGVSTCERAMAAFSNVVIDVMACAKGSTDGQAVAVVNAIADKANSQPA
jgi:hypothetical protein